MRFAPNKQNTLIIIPAYNEGQMIGKVIQKVKAQDFMHILVVDDGSTDESAKVLQAHEVHYISHEENQGTGAAIKSGIGWGMDKGYEFFLTLDGDDQHYPEDLPNLIEQLSEYDHVLGSRFLNPDNKIPHHRSIGNQVANTLVLLKGVRTTDSQSGICGFNRVVAESLLKTKSKRFEFWAECLLKIRQQQSHFLCSEIPVSVQYTKYSLKKGQGILQGSWTLFKILFV